MLNKRLRKSIFGGYKKKDVLSYITEYSQKVEGIICEKDDIIADMELSAKNDQDTILELKEQVGEMTESLSSLTVQVSELETQKEALNLIIAEHEQEKQVISRVMIAAQKEADEIRRTVRELMDKERSDFDYEMSCRRNKLETEIQELKAKSKAISSDILNLREAAATALGKYKSELEYMTKEYAPRERDYELIKSDNSVAKQQVDNLDEIALAKKVLDNYR